MALPLPLGASVTAPVSALPALFTDTDALPAPVEKAAVPTTISAPEFVIAPVEATVRLRPIVDAPRFVAILLVSATLFAPLFDNVTAPVNWLASVVGRGSWRERVEILVVAALLKKNRPIDLFV